MTRFLPLVITAVFALAAPAVAFHVGTAIADPGSGSAILDAGPDASSGSAVTPPSDKLHDPVLAPLEAYDDAVALKKMGWPLLVLGVLVMLTRGLATASTKWSIAWLAWLAKGTTAVVLSGMGACGAAAFNAIALGGTWMAALTAAAGALFLLIHPTPKAA